MKKLKKVIILTKEIKMCQIKHANFILSLCKHISCHRSFEIQINNQGLEPVA